jgi:hypothetical protein|tara:strand:+ start:1391 stop:1522 length:132 start_codon:yes stop_codon:yes gene_type:complete
MAIREITETDNSQHEDFNFDIVDLDPFELADEVKKNIFQEDRL